MQAQFHKDVSQQRYAEDLSAVGGMSNCTPISTPLPLQLNKLPDQDTPFFDPKYFRSLDGKLQYLTLTRPNLQYAVNYVCQKMHAPSLSDFNLLKRVIRYIKGTLHFGISFSKHIDFTLEAIMIVIGRVVQPLDDLLVVFAPS